MIDFEIELVNENPSWIAVLKAYQTAQTELAAQQAEAAEQSAKAAKSMAAKGVAAGETDQADSEAVNLEGDDADAGLVEAEDTTSPRKRVTRWVERITKLPGIEREELSRIHGRLIAYDLLKCDLAGRSTGMVYQLTSGGKEILRRFENEDVAEAA